MQQTRIGVATRLPTVGLCLGLALAAIACAAPEKPTRGSLDGLRARANVSTAALDAELAPRKRAQKPSGKQSRADAQPVATPQPRTRRNYPSHAFIVAVGEAGPEEATLAEQRARTLVASQVQSSIDSSFQTLSEEAFREDAGGTVRSASRERRRERIRVRTSFARNELIRIDPGRSGCDADGCRAFAYLDRSEALTAMGTDYRSLLARFDAEVARALASEKDWLAFTPRFRAAIMSFDALLAAAVPLYGIQGGAPEGLDNASEKHRQLGQAQTRVLGIARVHVLTHSGDEEAGGQVRSAITRGLRQRGIQATQARSCESGLGLVPAAELSCTPGFMGTLCKLELRVEVRDCAQDRLIDEVTVDTSGLNHAHADVRRARAGVLKRVDPALLMPPLAAALGELLPL